MENIYIFLHFIDKFLKFEGMEYFIHHVKFGMWLFLCKFPILFSKVKLKLGHNNSLIHQQLFKTGTLEYWS